MTTPQSTTQPKTTTILTPELVNRIAARSGIEPKFIKLWATQLITGFVTDDDGARLIAIWLDLLGREVAE